MKRISKNNKETKELGYSIPQNYFEELERSVMNKINVDKINSNHADKLGFTVPVGYFESLNETILGHVKPKKGRLITMITQYKFTISLIAALFVILFMAYNFILSNEKPIDTIAISNEQLLQDELLNSILVEDSKIEDYVANYVINDLLIKDVLANFIELDDTTLSLLFEKEATLDVYLDEYVEDLILEEIQ